MLRLRMFPFNRKPLFQLYPLPMNVPQFNEWANRIIEKAKLPTKDIETQKFALAGMILQSSPEAFERPDEYYVNLLKKAASDQLATAIIQELQAQRRKRIEASQKLEEQSKPSEVTQEQKGVMDGKKGA